MARRVDTQGAIPVDLVRPHIERWIARYDAEHENEKNGGTGSRAALAERSGVAQRRIWALLTGEQERLSWDTADRLLTQGIDEPELWHIDPELARFYNE